MSEQTKAKVKLLGHCPMCGRLQAVRNGMAHHGYTTKQGWFEGACQGAGHAPMETDRTTTDRLVAQIGEQVAGLRREAHDYETGALIPEMVPSSPQYGSSELVAWEDASEAAREAGWKREVVKLERRAEAGEHFASFLKKLVNGVHGKPLQEEVKKDAAEEIYYGERRKIVKGGIAKIAVAEGKDYSRRGRIKYRFEGCSVKRSITTRSWRLLEKAD